jgi:hypothetical protein
MIGDTSLRLGAAVPAKRLRPGGLLRFVFAGLVIIRRISHGPPPIKDLFGHFDREPTELSLISAGC